MTCDPIERDEEGHEPAPPAVRESVLREAERIMDDHREPTYGPPAEDAARWAALFAAVTGLDIRPEHFPLAQICVKLSRLGAAPRHWHRDSYVDIAGYARVAEAIAAGSS